jgi:hypothetical protein
LRPIIMQIGIDKRNRSALGSEIGNRDLNKTCLSASAEYYELGHATRSTIVFINGLRTMMNDTRDG